MSPPDVVVITVFVDCFFCLLYSVHIYELVYILALDILLVNLFT